MVEMIYRFTKGLTVPFIKIEQLFMRRGFVATSEERPIPLKRSGHIYINNMTVILCVCLGHSPTQSPTILS